MKVSSQSSLYCHLYLDKSKGIFKTLKLSLPDLSLNIESLKLKIQGLVSELNKVILFLNQNETDSTKFKLLNISKTISSPAITNKSKTSSFFEEKDDIYCKVEVEIKPAKIMINSSVDELQFKTLTKYSYYEATKKVIKVLIDLPGVHTVPKENIISKFETRSIELKIIGLNGKKFDKQLGLNYYFGVPNTHCPLVPENSEVLITTDKITIRIRKDKEDGHWSALYKHKLLMEK